MWLGVLLVLASVVIGAKLLATADDSVAVWTLEHDVRAGTVLTSDDLTSSRVHFEDAGAIDGYLLTSETIAPGVTLTRDASAGELLRRSGLTQTPRDARAQLPLAVSAAGAPADLAPGDRVDVWASPPPDTGKGHSVLVVRKAEVVSVSGSSAGGLAADRSVVVALDPDVDVGEILDRLNGASVVLIREEG